MKNILTNALAYYGEKYKLIDVPYIVDVDVSAETKPTFVEDLHHNKDKVYVGSGEQSFIQLMKENKLSDGKSMCLTPCYREESVLDDTHLKMFMKLELIDYRYKWSVRDEFMKEHLVALSDMLLNAHKFYKNNISVYDEIEIIKSDSNQYDIVINDFEVGSYGIRETSFGRFIYGTGLALPRFNQSIAQVQNL